MKQALRYLLVLIVLFSTLPGVATAQMQQTEPDSVVTSFELDDSGDAVWTIEYRTRIDSPETRETFLTMKSDISDDPTGYLNRFEGRIQRTVDDAEIMANRDMSVEEVQISVRLVEFPQEYGVVEYSFVWTNFAIVNGDNLIISDSLSGFFIEEDSRLVMKWSDEYAVKSVAPSPTARTDTSATWEGPVDFDRAGPILELQPESAVTPTPTEPEPTTPEQPPVDDPDASEDENTALVFSVGGVVLLVVGAALGAVGYAWLQNREEQESKGTLPAAEADAEPTTDEPADEDDDEPAPIDEALLSNEERVLRVLEQNGGRVKQQKIVSELGWTDAKTSLVVGDMRDNGELKVFRLGRENVISFPDEE